MSAAPSLRELQHRLEELLSLGGLPDYEARLDAATGALPIGGDARLSPAARLGVYTGMIFVRIRDAVAEDFAATAAVVGDQRWDALMARYLEAHPTDHPDLRLAGRHLPAYLRETEAVPLADLAQLEWALIDSFTAAPATVLRTEDLQQLAPEAWPALELRAVPSLRLLTASSASDQNRRTLLDGESVELESTGPLALRIWRRELRVFHKRIEAFEHEALALVSTGVTFADLCTWIDQNDQGEDASQQAVHLLQSWLADELLIATT